VSQAPDEFAGGSHRTTIRCGTTCEGSHRRAASRNSVGIARSIALLDGRAAPAGSHQRMKRCRKNRSGSRVRRPAAMRRNRHAGSRSSWRKWSGSIAALARGRPTIARVEMIRPRARAVQRLLSFGIPALDTALAQPNVQCQRQTLHRPALLGDASPVLRVLKRRTAEDCGRGQQRPLSARAGLIGHYIVGASGPLTANSQRP